MMKSPDLKLPDTGTAPPPPVLTTAPTGTKPKKKSQQPTFLGVDASPEGQANSGGNTLLGQA